MRTVLADMAAYPWRTLFEFIGFTAGAIGGLCLLLLAAILTGAI